VTFPEFQKQSADFARACAVALAASLPFSTALDNVLLGFILIGWLTAGDYRAQWERLRRHPVARAAVAFVALLALGLAYGERAPGDSMHYFGKYIDLLFAVILLALFDDARWRRRALLAFAGSLALLLALSYLIRYGAIPPNRWIAGTPGNPVVFKLWITHGILMAFGAYLFALRGLQAPQPGRRAIWYGLALLAAGNVLFMIQGRTGYVVLITLALYLGYAWRRFAGLAIAALCTATVIAVVFSLPGALHDRTELAIKEFRQAQSGGAARTSVGERFQFYRNSIAIIRDHPLLGVGTGGFPYAYQKQTAGTALMPTRNPHNEYLHILVQLGVVGLIALLALFWVPWRVAARLPTIYEQHLARGLILTIAAGCVFNSLLIDHTERLLFAWGLGILFAGLQSSNPSPPSDHT